MCLPSTKSKLKIILCRLRSVILKNVFLRKFLYDAYIIEAKRKLKLKIYVPMSNVVLNLCNLCYTIAWMFQVPTNIVLAQALATL